MNPLSKKSENFHYNWKGYYTVREINNKKKQTNPANHTKSHELSI